MEENIENLLLNINKKLDNLEQQNKQQSKEFNDKLDNLKQQNLTLEKEIKDLKQGQSSEEQLNKEINEDDLYYFYIVSDSLKLDYFKIGITNNIKSRLSSIQTGNPNKVYLIDFLVGNKENIIQLEKTLKNKMSDYNLSGEWFKLEDEARMKLFNWLNKVKLNKHQFNDILDLEIPKKDNEIKNIELEDNKLEIQIKKLSELKINEIIDLLKDYLKNVNGKLMFENNLTNDFSMDYGYLFEIIEVENIAKNDLNKKDFNELFDKLNNEYLCCFEMLNKNIKEENSFISMLLDDLKIPSLRFLFGIKRKDLFKIYVYKSFCRKDLNNVENEIKNNDNLLFKQKKFTFKDKTNKTINNVLQSENKNFNKIVLNFFDKYLNILEDENSFDNLNIENISYLFKKMNKLDDNDEIKKEFNKDVNKIINYKL